MLPRFEQFIRERQYVQNISPASVEWHRQSLAWLATESPTTEDLTACVIKMRDHGLKPTSVNCRLRSIKAYCKWAGLQTRVPKLKEPQLDLPTFSQDQISRLLGWKPKTMPQHRLSTSVAVLLDSGPRADEVLSLTWDNIDFDNLLVTLHGKGSKDRKVPMSLELRKRLFHWQRRSGPGLVFPTAGGTKQGRRDVLRDVKQLCRRLGFQPPARTLHAFRHTFATHYLRKGGSLVLLQRILGHTTLRYSHLVPADLSAVHEKLTLLS